MTTFVNEYEIDNFVERFGDDTPVLQAAALTLESLMHWTNANSDGWPYWIKPRRAATRLIDLLVDATKRPMDEWDDDVTEYEYRRALIPVKAFLTRQEVDHDRVIHDVKREPGEPEPTITMSLNERPYAERGLLGDLPQAVHDAAMELADASGEEPLGYRAITKSVPGESRVVVVAWQVFHTETVTEFHPDGTPYRQGVLHRFVQS